MTAPFFHQNHTLHRRHRTLNAIHTWLLVSGSLTLLAITAWAIAGSTGVIYAFVFGGITALAVRRMSPQMVLKMYKAQPVDAVRFPLGHRLVEELAARAGLEKVPQLHIVPSNMLNAFAVGRKDDSAIAVTDGLLRSLTARELAGVLAHEITHVRNEDVKVMALADMVSRFTSTLSTVGMISILFNVTGFFPTVPWLGVVAMIASPTIGSLLQLALSRTREFDADYGAAMLTGDPDGLSLALRKLEIWHRRRLESMSLPVGRMAEPSMLRSHPPTPERVARLDALRETLVSEPVAGIIETESLDAPIKKGRSPVPHIKPRFGRDVMANDAHWMSLAAASSPGTPPSSGVDDSRPCCDQPINRPDSDRPRIRVSRGGVWW